MKTSGHLDYLAITFPIGTPPDTFNDLVGGWKETGSGPHGYARKFVGKNGATLYDGGTAAMGVHLILKGQQLSDLRVDLSSDINLINFCASLYGRPSRVDLCVNLFEAHVTVEDLWALWENKQVRTNVRTAKRWLALEGEGTDNGFYIGTRESDKFLRVYDKARQLGSTSTHVRLELECHKARASAMSDSIQAAGNVRQVANKAILEHAAFYNDEYLLALQDNEVELVPVPKPEPAFYRWLRTQIAPAIVNRQLDYPDEHVLNVLKLLVDELSNHE